MKWFITHNQKCFNTYSLRCQNQGGTWKLGLPQTPRQLDIHFKYSSHHSSFFPSLVFYYTLGIIFISISGISLLLKVRVVLSRTLLINLCNAFVHSHINYCILTWGNTYVTHLKPLIILQKRAIRIITFSPFLQPTAELFRSLKILSVSQIQNFNTLMLIHKIRSKLVILETLKLLTPAKTRSVGSGNFLLPNIFTNYGKQRLQFNRIKHCNMLPDDIKLITSLTSFKKHLKNHLITN